MSATSRADVRALSQVLFGQLYRLEVMTAIASYSDGLVCLSDLARDLNVTASNLQKPLRDLVRAGLVSRLPSGDSKRKFYARNDSLAWAFALEIAATAERLSLSEQLP